MRDLRATSHMRLRACHHCPSMTHWWKRRSQPMFAPHYAWGANIVCGCKMDIKWHLRGFLHGIEWIMFHGHLDYFQKPPLRGRPDTKPWDHYTPKSHNCWSLILYHVWGPRITEIAFGWGLGHLWLHTTFESPRPYHMILEVSWDGLWTLSFGLSQFHGHGSWHINEVALRLRAHQLQIWISISHNTAFGWFSGTF
jgi:hypothetical protein